MLFPSKFKGSQIQKFDDSKNRSSWPTGLFFFTFYVFSFFDFFYFFFFLIFSFWEIFFCSFFIFSFLLFYSFFIFFIFSFLCLSEKMKNKEKWKTRIQK